MILMVTKQNLPTYYFELEMIGRNNARIKKVVKQVLNEAFDIALTENECSDAANRIIDVLSKKH